MEQKIKDAGYGIKMPPKDRVGAMCVRTPLVSVILPVYKVEPYIRQALNSVLNQTYKNLQVILVDDGSPDNCGRICDEYAEKDNRIIVIHKENGGVSSARNAGINAATGEWIYFMDSDDWIEPETLEICMHKALEADVDLVLFDSERFDNTKHSTQKVRWLKDVGAETVYDDLPTVNSFMRFVSRGSMCVCVVKGGVIKDKLLFDEELYYEEDAYFRWELYPHLNSYLYIPRVLYHYRLTPNSATACHDVMRIIQGRLAKHVKTMSTIAAGGYPANALEMESGQVVGQLSLILADILLGGSDRNYAQKREIICRTINSDAFKNALKNCNRDTLGLSAKIFFTFKRFPVFAIYLIHYLREMHAVLRTIQTKLERRISNAKT